MLGGRYQIIRQLSEGGFGVTHLAQDIMRPGNPQCVVKELHHHHQNAPQIIRLFNQEAEMLERLGEHEQIPRLLASFTQANRFYLVQEYIDGVTLEDALEGPSGKKQRKSEAEVIALLCDVLKALAFVHQHQVVHRDIKPANLMRRKRDGKIMLIDFGAVKELTHSQLRAKGRITTTVSIGTPGYSPHEQIALGNPRPASDIYALGITAIEMLTGVYPSELATDPNTAELVWHNRCRVSPKLAQFVDQMVRHHFSRRFQGAREALAELESVLLSSPVPSRTVMPKTKPTMAVAPRFKLKAKPRRNVVDQYKKRRISKANVKIWLWTCMTFGIALFITSYFVCSLSAYHDDDLWMILTGFNMMFFPAGHDTIGLIPSCSLDVGCSWNYYAVSRTFLISFRCLL